MQIYFYRMKITFIEFCYISATIINHKKIENKDNRCYGFQFIYLAPDWFPLMKQCTFHKCFCCSQFCQFDLRTLEMAASVFLCS